MQLTLIVLIALICHSYGHGPHEGNANQPHVARKMEDYVHDTEYDE